MKSETYKRILEDATKKFDKSMLMATKTYCVAHTSNLQESNYLYALESMEEAQKVFKGVVSHMKEYAVEILEESEKSFYCETDETYERCSIFVIEKRSRANGALGISM